MPTQLTVTDTLYSRTRDRLLEDLRLCWRASSDVQPLIGFRDLIVADEEARSFGNGLEQVSRHYSIDRAFVIRKKDANTLPECWVDVEEENYRNIFHAFLRNYLGFPKATRLPPEAHIDHVLSRERAKSIYGMTFVRLALAKGDVNSTFGSMWEKSAESNALLTRTLFQEHSDTPPRAAHLYWPLATKAFGIEAPRDPTMPVTYILATVRQLLDLGLLEESDKDTPFGLMVGVFRLGATGIPEHNAQKRVRARLKIDGDRELTEDSPLRDWMEATVRTAR